MLKLDQQAEEDEENYELITRDLRGMEEGLYEMDFVGIKSFGYLVCEEGILTYGERRNGILVVLGQIS